MQIVVEVLGDDASKRNGFQVDSCPDGVSSLTVNPIYPFPLARSETQYKRVSRGSVHQREPREAIAEVAPSQGSRSQRR